MNLMANIWFSLLFDYVKKKSQKNLMQNKKALYLVPRTFFRFCLVKNFIKLRQEKPLKKSCYFVH